MKDTLCARSSATAWADHQLWVMLGIRALVGEAALGHMLLVPGQLLPTTGPAADTPAPPAVIPAAKRTYAEAATTPALERATHVYVQGGGLPLADNYAGPALVLEKGPKVFKLQLGERTKVVRRDRLKPHAGQAPPGAAEPPCWGRPLGEDQDLLHDFRRSRGSYVAGT